MRIQRSEFVKSPANLLLQAEDSHDVIQLTRYFKRTHVIVPTDELTDEVQKRIERHLEQPNDEPWPQGKTFFVYDDEGIGFTIPKDGDPHQLIGVKISVQPFYAGDHWKMDADSWAATEASFEATAAKKAELRVGPV